MDALSDGTDAYDGTAMLAASAAATAHTFLLRRPCPICQGTPKNLADHLRGARKCREQLDNQSLAHLGFTVCPTCDILVTDTPQGRRVHMTKRSCNGFTVLPGPSTPVHLTAGPHTPVQPTPVSLTPVPPTPVSYTPVQPTLESYAPVLLHRCRTRQFNPHQCRTLQSLRRRCRTLQFPRHRCRTRQFNSHRCRIHQSYQHRCLTVSGPYHRLAMG